MFIYKIKCICLKTKLKWVVFVHSYVFFNLFVFASFGNLWTKKNHSDTSKSVHTAGFASLAQRDVVLHQSVSYLCLYKGGDVVQPR